MAIRYREAVGLIGLIGIGMLFFNGGCSSDGVRLIPVRRFSLSPWGAFSAETPLVAFDTGAERRLVISSLSPFTVCAEPSPDVAQNLTEALAAALKAEAAKEGSINIELASATARVAKQLMRRSQGLQLFRDGSYSLCQAFMNKSINAIQYQDFYTKLLVISSKLIEEELPLLKDEPYDKSPPASLPPLPKLQLEDSTETPAPSATPSPSP